MTVDNVTKVLGKLRSQDLRTTLKIPFSVWNKRYSTDKENTLAACADYYVNYSPDASWRDLTRTLYLNNEFVAARESKLFMSTGKYYHGTIIIANSHNSYI